MECVIYVWVEFLDFILIGDDVCVLIEFVVVVEGGGFVKFIFW